ncbi:PTS lactose/cellobiose transporter subunit IIA [Paenibacillus sp. 8b26]|uniref:PTS lactose/cellobiose transporter subunit IIA n=1 Tax=Paenibacillus sp. 8b26 TaxID=3424133 RepID=UPI003D65D6F8
MPTNDVEELQMRVFGLISGAGEAKSNFYEALEMARLGKYDEAEQCKKNGQQALKQAHRVQTDLITEEASGTKTEVGILMVHAQDHLMNTILVKELLDQLITMQKEINVLKQQLGVVKHG